LRKISERSPLITNTFRLSRKKHLVLAESIHCGTKDRVYFYSTLCFYITYLSLF
jgi:hypothetical protein